MPVGKQFIEWEGIKLIIEEKSMKSKKNQFNTPPLVKRKPFKRRDDQVTRETIALAILYATLGFVGIYALINWLG
jgi:hypothetical protein